MRRQWPISLLIALIVGLGLGLYYAWIVNPVVTTNISPAFLAPQYKQQYVIMASLAYADDHDLQKLATRLASLEMGDQTFQYVADTACDLARTSYASTTTGQIAIRAMIVVAARGGKTSCAATLIPISVTNTAPPTVPGAQFTPTIEPSDVPTKTPSPTPGTTFTPATPILPTATLASDFTLVSSVAACNPKTPGLVQIEVYDSDGKTGLPAQPITVTGGNEPDTFFTGLMPENGDGYADFHMTPGGSFLISLPGADRKASVDASDCTAKDGTKTIVSYLVIYRRAVRQ